MTGTEQRLADLERQLDELRRDFETNNFRIDRIFSAGYRAGRESITGRQDRAVTAASRALRSWHLRVVSGAS